MVLLGAVTDTTLTSEDGFSSISTESLTIGNAPNTYVMPESKPPAGANKIIQYNQSNGQMEWIDIPSGGGGGTTLSGLSDTNITSPDDGQMLVYNGGTGQWENKDVVQRLHAYFNNGLYGLPGGFNSANSWIPVLLTDTTILDSAFFTINTVIGTPLPNPTNSSSEVEFSESGQYLVTGHFSTQLSSTATSGATEVIGRLEKYNGATWDEVFGSLCFSYMEVLTVGSTMSFSVTSNFTTGDKIRLACKTDTSGAAFTLKRNANSITIQKI